MPGHTRETNLTWELRVTAELCEWVRDELRRVRKGSRQVEAATAIAAAAAEETYRLTDRLPEWQNDTSSSWRLVLGHVWDRLAGDQQQHYFLSRAVADFLVSPLNHVEGQDGPDDFDRPQTVAAYAAVVSTMGWGTDLAIAAITQIFDAIDLVHDGNDGSPDRRADVECEMEFVRRVVTTVVGSEHRGTTGFTPDLLAAIRS